jgi:hypothetical protein
VSLLLLLHQGGDGYSAAPSYANLARFTEQLDNAAWVKTRATVAADATAAPDGATTADKIVEDATASSTHICQQTISSLINGAAYHVGIRLKAGERTWARLVLTNASGTPSAFINLATGALGSVVGTWEVADAGNGWWLLHAALVMTATGLQAQVFLATANNTTSYSGDNASGLHAWGLQLTKGAALVPYRAQP